jgi:hypothetical protein
MFISLEMYIDSLRQERWHAKKLLISDENNIAVEKIVTLQLICKTASVRTNLPSEMAG